MSLRDELELDLEAAFPFQLLALLLWPTGILELMRDRGDGLLGVLLFTGAVLLLFQPMVLVRTFDRSGRTQRWAYLLANELYVLITLLLLFSLQTLGPRRTFSPDVEALRRSRQQASLHLPRAEAAQRSCVG
jgi:NADH:ubiquinone oxidoreductase subunit 6 (subunit J)